MVNLSTTTVLNNGVSMPIFGLGVYKAEDGEEVKQAVEAALEAGYRLIDTASFYKNEAGVGEAIKASGIPREELFITTKVWNDQQGYESTLAAFEESRTKLGLESIDLYLIHWPIKGKYKETWRALEKLYKEGKVRAIGVSNFKAHHIEDLLSESEIVPAVNQIELHPRLTQEEDRAYCIEKGIKVEAWSPLMRGRLFDEPLLMDIAEKHGKTTAQVILRWNVQHQIITIPKSVKKQRIIENSNIFDFELTAEEMKAIDGLNQNIRTGMDPDEVS
ncbi:diketogulonate reductase-like aldo/keto reductase [Pullulanibacillus pueri]|uniref:Glyoxal reductase n=1 Tax=Pullulanibacillus pueri TaxID=1437324 RepID=A0A8J2ZXZ4_9BACL|nr:aldo/keto reductase [Pullulanibacillus pueri]MBM7683205.1 diketogulonate reductase-like aldo/keto reductase [Pullulanibacillus pueri]GGH85582.1 glyoxal reductase [Pullulanibacillus pueri]